MATKIKQIISDFISNQKQYPIVYAIAAGLYPILFYYSNNFTLVNTWAHLAYFVFYFLMIPIVLFILLAKIFTLSLLQNWRKFLFPFLNVATFLILLKISYYAGVQKKIILGILIVSGLFSYFFSKQLKKVVVFQFLLAILSIGFLIPKIYKQITNSTEWLIQPDDIEKVVFKNTPNVYFIQPDGYVNFSELDKGYYQIDNTDFASFLTDNKFNYYNNFRSNYASTLSSNSATFMMKHHYYNEGTSLSESVNARNILITKNSVLDVFKNNNYKTHFVTEKPYLLLNRPKMGYDACNISYQDVSYIGTGLGQPLDLLPPIKNYLESDTDVAKFFFIEFFNPGHITRRELDSDGIDEEKKLWKESLDSANEKLKKIITLINDKDPNSIIIIMADHGGFVGMKNTIEVYNKTEDRDLIYSIFSSSLAIRWPNNHAPKYDVNLKSAVNVFRILFSYLGDNEKYLQHLQNNSSYVIIRNGAPKGVYQYIDEVGNITFKKQ